MWSSLFFLLAVESENFAALASVPTVEWHAPRPCPSAAAMQRAVGEALAGTSPGAARTIRARIWRTRHAGWRMQITTTGASFGVVRGAPVPARTCRELADYFLFYTKEVWLAAAVEQPKPRPPQPPERSRALARIRLAGRGGIGAMPDAAAAGGIQLMHALDVRRARFEIGAAFDTTPAKLVIQEDPRNTLTVRFFRWTLLVRGCGDLTAGSRSVQIHLCGGVEGGLLRAENRSTAPVLNVHLAPALTWWFHRHIGLWAGVAGGLNIVRPRPCLTSEGRCGPETKGPVHLAWKTPLVFVDVAAGFEFRLARDGSGGSRKDQRRGR